MRSNSLDAQHTIQMQEARGVCDAGTLRAHLRAKAKGLQSALPESKGNMGSMFLFHSQFPIFNHQQPYMEGKQTRPAQISSNKNGSACVADLSGGAMYIERGDLDLRGSCSMENCSSLGSGGGLLMVSGGEPVSKSNGVGSSEPRPSICSDSARKKSAFLVTHAGVRQQARSRLTFWQCSAYDGHGGGMMAHSLVSRGTIEFRSCAASTRGAGC